MKTVFNRNHIFTSARNKQQRITKENAINHECVMITRSLRLGLPILPELLTIIHIQVVYHDNRVPCKGRTFSVKALLNYFELNDFFYGDTLYRSASDML
jgi:hypothetical protein